MNPYTVLGISENASSDEVKKAYRKLVKEYHPDVDPSENAKARFQEIQDAYDSLRGDKPRNTHQSQQNRSAEDIFGDMFRRFQEQQQFNIWANIDLTLLQIRNGCFVKIRTADEIVDFEVPAGTINGQQFVIPNKGGYLDNQRGSLIINIREIPDAVFARSQEHLHMRVPINVIDMMLGKEIEITLLDARTKTVTIPANSHPQSYIAVKGEGMPDMRGGMGNLYISLEPIFETLSDEQLEKLSLVRNLSS